jgi:hypothetical protein
MASPSIRPSALKGPTASQFLAAACGPSCPDGVKQAEVPGFGVQERLNNMNDEVTEEASTAATQETEPTVVAAIASGDGQSLREQAIRERAYAMWEEEGRPDGKDLDHWYRAEAEIDSSGEYAKDKMPDDVQQSPKPAASRSRERRNTD